jgi:hypothetical protein
MLADELFEVEESKLNNLNNKKFLKNFLRSNINNQKRGGKTFKKAFNES